MPISYIARTRERYAGHLPYKWAVNTEAPWTPLLKPIKECRLALVSSGGFYLKTQPPFQDDDTSYRTIPVGTPLKELRIHHHGYRDADVDLDPNCVFPLDRLRELEAAGALGALVDPALSYVMVYSARREREERAPKIVAELKDAKADAVLLVPV